MPSFEILEEYARNEGIPFTSREGLIARPEIEALFRRIVDERTKDLGRVEQIKKFTLLPKEFSQETGEITPTMKIRRKFVTEKYSDVIEAMYSEN